jgi:hypothetical protein
VNTTARRLSVIFVLVGAALLLALPGVAGANVRAKYRAEYKATLTSLDKGFNAFARNYDNMKSGAVHQSEIMVPWIGDPNQHEQLVSVENWCLKVYNMNKGMPQTWAMSYWRSVNTFSGKARRYFATAAQQRKFKSACARLKAYSGMLVELGNEHVYDAYRLLGMDPPAIDLATKAIADADEDAAGGHEGVDKSFRALRALQ